MTAGSDLHLTRFERASTLALSMGIVVDLGIALVISESSLSKATDQQVESTRHMAILDRNFASIHRFYTQRARHWLFIWTWPHMPSTCGLSQASSSD